MSLEVDGFTIERQVVARKSIAAIRDGMFEIMRPHVPMAANDPVAIDKGFLALGAKSPELKRNCYRLFGKLAAVPGLLADPGISRAVEDAGFSDATIQSYSVFCLEPGNVRNTFLPHQDLRERTSLKSLLLWVPLSAGKNLGGMACYAGTHRGGPIRHGITDAGKPFVPPEAFAGAERFDIVEFDVGDVVLMDPYLVHESIRNTGSGVRWTAVIKLDSVRDLKHLETGPTPFPIEQFIDLRTNEERLRPA